MAGKTVRALTAEQKEEFARIGYLKVGRVLTDEQLTALRDALDRSLRGESSEQPVLFRNLAGGGAYDRFDDDSHGPPAATDGSGKGVVIQIVNIWEAEDAFLHHLYNPTITSLASQLIGDDVLRVWHDQIQYKPPRVGGITGWHQDYPAWPILQPADLVSAWVALDDATIENGCMRMVPGSHRWGIHKGLGTDEENGFRPTHDPSQLPEGARVESVPLEVKAGECAFHHCLTWHGSPRNRSDRKRRAIAVHYMPGYTRYVPAGGHPMNDYVEVAPGEVLRGRAFPTVYDRGPLEPEAARA